VAENIPVLRLDRVCKSYAIGTPVEVEVLHDVDLELQRGEFVALMGPSGSGKSTLLNIIGLLDRPTRGRLFIKGQETSKLDDAAITALRSHSVGFVFQYHYLISAFTALENVMMPLLVENAFPSDEMHRRARQLLAQVGLTQWENNLANNMSGGQQQRVAIARALIADPTIIVADEPTGDLDRVTAEEILGLLDRLNREIGKTIIMVTHDPKAAGKAHRVIQLEKGVLAG
jgi:lipoprotein-releasing system ATP-binding protein